MNKSRKIFLPGAGLALAVLAMLLLVGPMAHAPAQATEVDLIVPPIVAPTDLEIEKTLLEGPEQIGIYLPEPTQFVFEIAYSNPNPDTPVRIIDAIPAEFEPLSVTADVGEVDVIDRKKAADRIEWDLPAWTFTATLTVVVETVPNPGRGHGALVFKPTSCGPLPLNPGATAYEVDPDTGKIVKVLNRETLELEAVIIVGPSNSLVVEAVEGDKPCEEG